MKKISLIFVTCTLLVSCVANDPRPSVIKNAQDKSVTTSQKPVKNITGFSEPLRCMDNLLVSHRIKDISIISEDINDKTKKISAGTKDMLTSAISEMTRRSRAVRLVQFGNDNSNVINYLKSANNSGPFSNAELLPEYAIMGSISQFEDNLGKQSQDIGISLPIGGVGIAKNASAKVLGLDMSVLRTSDLSVLPGVLSKNSIILIDYGTGKDSEASFKKYGLTYTTAISSPDGQTIALRNLVELASIELIGKLAKVPYWQCLGASVNDLTVNSELEDWYFSMKNTPNQKELISYLQSQFRALDIYFGAVDGVANSDFKNLLVEIQKNIASNDLEYDFFSKLLNSNKDDLRFKLEKYRKAVLSEKEVNDFEIKIKPFQSNQFVSQVDSKRSVSFEISTNKPSFTYCFYLNEDLEISRIFPNRFLKDSSLQPNSPKLIPSQGKSFQILSNDQGKTEAVVCYATSKDLSSRLSSELNANDLETMPQGTTFQDIKNSLEKINDNKSVSFKVFQYVPVIKE